MIFQLFMFFYVRTWDFYEPHVIDPDQDDSSQKCYENSSLFLFANFQYLCTCVAFSISKPFRQPLYTNYAFSIALLVLTIFTVIIALADFPWMLEVFQIMPNISLEFKVILVIIAIGNSLATFLFEKIVIWHVSLWWKNKKDK
jgi:magnesium-transporting ATPase (P-type)